MSQSENPNGNLPPIPLPAGSDGIFAIRGNLDGELADNFSEREQFIGLLVGDEEFYMAISAVHEIVMLQPITYVPGAHAMIEGVVNLRGTIMPALNLRKMMGVEKGKATPATRMIITYFQENPVSLIVDGITYVVSLFPSEIEDQSLPGKSQGADFISRIAKSTENVVGIFDLQKIVSSVQNELEIDEDASEAAS